MLSPGDILQKISKTPKFKVEQTIYDMQKSNQECA